MKRFLSVLTVLVLLLFALPSQGAAQIDYSFIKEYSDFFSFDIDEDGNAFISSNFDAPVFTHKNLPLGYNSLFYTDILVADYYSTPRAVWRIWIAYTAAKSLGITSATIHLNGTDYTFDIGNSMTATHYDDFVAEEFPIVIGSENYHFWASLLLELTSYNNINELYAINIPVTLHGAVENINFYIPSDAIVDLTLIGKAIFTMVGYDGIMKTYGSPVNISQLPPNVSI